MATLLVPGDPAPWFHAAALDGNPRYAFDSVAGRPIVLLFHGSAAWPASQEALQVMERHRHLFDDANACFFGVSIDPADAQEKRIEQSLPGIRWFLDHDRAVSERYGAIDGEGEGLRYRPQWLLLDAMLRVVQRAEIAGGEGIMAALAALTGQDRDTNAPVLIAPRILEPALCRRLIDLYETVGGEESGFMREENGMTVLKVDHGHKRRLDCIIEDQQLIATLRARLNRFLRPMINRAFQFDATRVERWIVACYDGDNGGGHFRAHRDNTTKGTAHRKFACTINLNADDYDGGDLRFPEFGARTYRAPTGGAAVFSCSLLHEATPVTRGKRYAFLPFLYDDAGAALREQNLRFLAPDLGTYSAGTAPAP
ncbi:redoxin domain-containing protein [Sphingomonas sp. So64.6b]|uniref:2OG-Fe(II) oxygenase n=1 Tax=Sphingomonas sp. So64.6b TaxID=2997354 RepID=UPI001600C5D2|nr:2OG-Fe(II) oxygenase [Sphingomonas sp. So64.6b]QNA83978.1 redoxin domain-containing protein [Sphingomonas sp. So64.6b]